MPKQPPTDDIDLIEDEIVKAKKAHNREIGKAKPIKVRSTVEKAKDEYHRSKDHHKQEIAKLKNSISLHKMMIKQSKLRFKIIKASNKYK